VGAQGEGPRVSEPARARVEAMMLELGAHSRATRRAGIALG
jgi:hypothetical protein